MDCYKTQAAALLDLWEELFIHSLKYPFIFAPFPQMFQKSDILSLDATLSQKHGIL
ncbi:MAG: hypothetical protein IBJ00_03600 [Alphaproteobacteria bacterium]|nr:hypothetical protein [Alphaproteobacteria bacterium]